MEGCVICALLSLESRESTTFGHVTVGGYSKSPVASGPHRMRLVFGVQYLTTRLDRRESKGDRDV